MGGWSGATAGNEPELGLLSYTLPIITQEIKTRQQDNKSESVYFRTRCGRSLNFVYGCLYHIQDFKLLIFLKNSENNYKNVNQYGGFWKEKGIGSKILNYLCNRILLFTMNNNKQAFSWKWDKLF